MKTFLKIPGLLFLLLAVTLPCFAMIDVGELSKKGASELGIEIKRRPNGDAGELVWIELKKEGFLEKLTYCELRMREANGKHLVAARLQSNPVMHDQANDVISFSFSVDPSQLDDCSFFLVAYGSSREDVGYELKVKDFLGSSKE